MQIIGYLSACAVLVAVTVAMMCRLGRKALSAPGAAARSDRVLLAGREHGEQGGERSHNVKAVFAAHQTPGSVP